MRRLITEHLWQMISVEVENKAFEVVYTFHLLKDLRWFSLRCTYYIVG